MVSDATMIRELESLALIAIPASCIVLSIVAFAAGDRASHYSIIFALIFAASTPLMMMSTGGVMGIIVAFIAHIYMALFYYILLFFGIPVGFVGIFAIIEWGAGFENTPLMFFVYMCCFGGPLMIRRFMGLGGPFDG
ncbi:hypothetical protein E2974_15975 [Paracoccus yeei]|uniref:hypothetical protein n=1 Tax=Paracoccus yeei TaxID=147645 RepID=UPI0037D162C4